MQDFPKEQANSTSTMLVLQCLWKHRAFWSSDLTNKLSMASLRLKFMEHFFELLDDCDLLDLSWIGATVAFQILSISLVGSWTPSLAYSL